MINSFYEVKEFVFINLHVPYISFTGDVVLKDLKLQAEARSSLKLPVIVQENPDASQKLFTFIFYHFVLVPNSHASPLLCLLSF